MIGDKPQFPRSRRVDADQCRERMERVKDQVQPGDYGHATARHFVELKRIEKRQRSVLT